MSDSELSEASHTPVPLDDQLEQSLRREVVQAAKLANDFTLRQIREASEKSLSLPIGFYKGHKSWNAKSKEIVQDQIDNEPAATSSPVVEKSKPIPKAKKSTPKPSKRESQAQNGRSKKKQKTRLEESEEELSSPLIEMDTGSEPEKKPENPKGPPKPVYKKSVAPKKPGKPKSEPLKSEIEAGESDAAAEEKSDSELSSLVDEEPKLKKKNRGRDSQDGKPAKAKASKFKTEAEEDPDQAEIKRLQGWLVKCGIRKLWGKELKAYETPKAKIRHLKNMLAEAGMTGRYSQEKANQIKEARELAADIEAVQEGEQRWGTGDKDAGEDGERPERRLVRGSKNYDFLSSGGEETD